ncbi:hypothetical protein ACFSSC_03385 [Corynebacterium mendelii]|uniref:Tetratricopeptide repeat protein n=2 Tax=Corynebacterium mendelii TaxID=2765362 RepID=A0A939DYG6_9CORY|nr:hypothetical protein [Corynebacterium mendelii]MBN9643554.1 hypothetical protein [Corynebacterium mendelii]
MAGGYFSRFFRTGRPTADGSANDARQLEKTVHATFADGAARRDEQLWLALYQRARAVCGPGSVGCTNAAAGVCRALALAGKPDKAVQVADEALRARKENFGRADTSVVVLAGLKLQAVTDLGDPQAELDTCADILPLYLESAGYTPPGDTPARPAHDSLVRLAGLIEHYLAVISRHGDAGCDRVREDLAAVAAAVTADCDPTDPATGIRLRHAVALFRDGEPSPARAAGELALVIDECGPGALAGTDDARAVAGMIRRLCETDSRTGRCTDEVTAVAGHVLDMVLAHHQPASSVALDIRLALLERQAATGHDDDGDAALAGWAEIDEELGQLRGAETGWMVFDDKAGPVVAAETIAALHCRVRLSIARVLASRHDFQAVLPWIAAADAEQGVLTGADRIRVSREIRDLLLSATDSRLVARGLRQADTVAAHTGRISDRWIFATALMSTRHYGRATQELQALLADDSRELDPRIRLAAESNLVVCLMNLGHTEQAVDGCYRLIDRMLADPDTAVDQQVTVRTNLAVCLSKLGRFTDAAGVLDALIAELRGHKATEPAAVIELRRLRANVDAATGNRPAAVYRLQDCLSDALALPGDAGAGLAATIRADLAGLTGPGAAD